MPKRHTLQHPQSLLIPTFPPPYPHHAPTVPSPYARSDLKCAILAQFGVSRTLEGGLGLRADWEVLREAN